MDEDLRCCGTGTCLINAEGVCWCGQQWDGEKMCFPEKLGLAENPKSESPPAASQPAINEVNSKPVEGGTSTP